MPISGRLYTASFTNVSVSAVQDLFGLYPGSTRVIAVHGIELGQVSSALVSQLRLRLRTLPVTVTSGSGGGTVTPRAHVPNDSASGITARINDTTQATTSGTALDIESMTWNTLNPLLWTPMVVGRPPVLATNSALILSLDAAPASTLAISGTITYEEVP